MNTSTTNIPEAVTQYIDATNRFDAASAAACFTPEATVHDDGKTHVGTDEITDWVSHASKEYQPQASVVNAQQKGDKVAVTLKITGQFPGSPVELDFEFSLRNEKIAELTIR